MDENENPIDAWQVDCFPDGQVLFTIDDSKFGKPTSLHCSLMSSDHLLILEQIYDVLRRRGINLSAFLIQINYLYGGRADKDCFTVPNLRDMVLSKITEGNIVSKNNPTANIYVLDPHTITPNPPAKLKTTMVSPVSHDDYNTILFPDQGAHHRYTNILGNKKKIVASKVRDAHGKIVKYTVPPIDSDSSVLVVDDICDGGATFFILRESVPENIQLDLHVTHGIFSGVNTLQKLLGGYRKVFTTNSFQTLSNRAEIKRLKEEGKNIRVANVWPSNSLIEEYWSING